MKLGGCLIKYNIIYFVEEKLYVVLIYRSSRNLKNFSSRFYIIGNSYNVLKHKLKIM